MNSKTDTPVIYIQTLGGLRLSVGDNYVNAHSQQSKKPWALLEYLIVFRDKDISSNELIEVIWGEDSGINPAGALKTLLFRARKILEPLGIPTQELIVHQRHSYAWTRKFETKTDIDQFDQLYKTVFASGTDPNDCKEAGLLAAELYKGDFLPQSGLEPWVVPISTYYHSLYLNLIHRLLEIFSSEQAYRQIIFLCREAITVEAFDEDLHFHMINALYQTGNTHAAMEHYLHMTDIFYNEYAIAPSDKLKELYKFIQSSAHQFVTDLTTIQNQFQNSNTRNGAFFCEYAVFKDIYLLESQAVERTKEPIYLCLFTVFCGKETHSQTPLFIRALEAFQASINTSLRKCDVYSRYNANQYILLLHSATYENSVLVMKRILHKFKTEFPNQSIKITYSLEAVTTPTGKPKYEIKRK